MMKELTRNIWHFELDEWTQQMWDILDARKRGDFAFCDKDFKTAIECYSQFIDVGTMVSPTVYADLSLCHLMCDEPDPALRDEMQAQCRYADWPTPFYMQAVALSKLNMQSDAKDMLHEEKSSSFSHRYTFRLPSVVRNCLVNSVIIAPLVENMLQQVLYDHNAFGLPFLLYVFWPNVYEHSIKADCCF